MPSSRECSTARIASTVMEKYHAGRPPASRSWSRKSLILGSFRVAARAAALLKRNDCLIFLFASFPDAVDMFVVANATFRILYVLMFLPRPQRIIHFEITQNRTQVWLASQMTEAFPWDSAPPAAGPGRNLWSSFPRPRRGDANQPEPPLRDEGDTCVCLKL
jgi:hypothetical protein